MNFFLRVHLNQDRVFQELHNPSDVSMISQVSQAKGLEAIEEDNDEMYDERGRTIGVDNVDFDFLPGYDHLTSLDGLKPDTHFDSEPTDTPTINPSFTLDGIRDLVFEKKFNTITHVQIVIELRSVQ
jgi:hypothetical protein